MNMTKLLSKLQAQGYSEEYIQQEILPDWWDEKLDSKSAAVLEVAGHIARSLNLDIKTLTR